MVSLYPVCTELVDDSTVQGRKVNYLFATAVNLPHLKHCRHSLSASQSASSFELRLLIGMSRMILRESGGDAARLDRQHRRRSRRMFCPANDVMKRGRITWFAFCWEGHVLRHGLFRGECQSKLFQSASSNRKNCDNLWVTNINIKKSRDSNSTSLRNNSR